MMLKGRLTAFAKFADLLVPGVQ